MWVYNIVAAVIVWDLTHSATAVGGVSIALSLPQFIVAPLSGAHADGGRVKGQLVLGRVLVAGPSALLVLAIALVGTDGLPGAYAVILPSAIAGVGFAIGSPAQLAILPSLVRDEELSRAVALNSIPPTAARAGGPALGSLLLLTAGAAWAFAFTMATNLAFALVCWWLPLDQGLESADPDGSARGTVREGFAYVRRHREVGLLLLGTLAVGFGSDPVVTLTPVLSASFGHGEALVGALVSIFGLGAGLGYFGIAGIHRRAGANTVWTLGLGCLVVGTAMAGLSPALWGVFVGMVISGVGFSWGVTGVATGLFEVLPEHFRGRVMALYSMAFVGSKPAAAALSGTLADNVSLPAAFVAAAMVVALIGGVASVGARGAAGPTPSARPPVG